MKLIIKAYEKEFVWDDWIEIELEDIWISLTYPPNNFIDLLNLEKDLEVVYF